MRKSGCKQEQMLVVPKDFVVCFKSSALDISNLGSVTSICRISWSSLATTFPLSCTFSAPPNRFNPAWSTSCSQSHFIQILRGGILMEHYLRFGPDGQFRAKVCFLTILSRNWFRLMSLVAHWFGLVKLKFLLLFSSWRREIKTNTYSIFDILNSEIVQIDELLTKDIRKYLFAYIICWRKKFFFAIVD